MVKTLYFNLEDDIKTILARVKGEHSPDLVLVFPRRSYLFADAVNLKLLKKQLDVLRKNEISQLAVTNGGKYEGIIHLHDLIREGII